jgi:hypothetical protein
MPQHPKYSNSPKKNLADLNNLLYELEKFGFIHEEIDQPIRSLISSLNPEAFTKHTLASNWLPVDSNIEDYEEDEIEYSTTPSADDLWEYIDTEQEEQFIQDYRNVIALCIYENGHMLMDDVETTNRLIEMRDIEYYRMHIHADEDAETKKKYELQSRTVWFPEDTYPVRIGIYEISKRDYQNAKHDGYAYWNGKKWFDSKILLKNCIDQKKTKENEKSWGSYCWRGFLEQQSN